MSRPGLRISDQGEADIAWRVFDTGEVTRNFALRSEDYDRARMGELASACIPGKVITDTICQPGNGTFVTGEKMPAVGVARPTVALGIDLLLSGSGERAVREDRS